MQFKHSKEQLNKNKNINTILKPLENSGFDLSIAAEFYHSVFYTLKTKNNEKLVNFTVFKDKTILQPPLAVRFLVEFDFQINDEFSTNFKHTDDLFPAFEYLKTFLENELKKSKILETEIQL